MTVHIFFLFGIHLCTPRTISLCEGIGQHCGITSNVALSIYSYCWQHNIHKLFWLPTLISYIKETGRYLGLKN